MYNAGILKSTSFPFPVIVVGNLSTGGTGKSPMTEYILQLLKTHYSLAVLSRGYKRKTSGFVHVTSQHTFEDVGDEPLQFFTKFNDITVAVHEKRVAGIKQLQAQKKHDVVVLDDAYQHRSLRAGFYVLLTSYEHLFLDDYLLPMGNLRELRVGARRADSILVTKCPPDLSREEQERIQTRIHQQFSAPVYFTSIQYADSIRGESNDIAVKDLSDSTVLLLTGIANPKPLSSYLVDQQFDVIHLQYPDHYSFTSTDITKIKAVFEGIESPRKCILTTEKDYMRLRGKLPQLYYLGIETVFLNKKEDFDNQLLDFCNR